MPSVTLNKRLIRSDIPVEGRFLTALIRRVQREGYTVLQAWVRVENDREAIWAVLETVNEPKRIVRMLQAQGFFQPMRGA